MNKKEFHNGQKLDTLLYIRRNGCLDIDSERDECDIEVVMENGQMAGVPWALVTYRKDGSQLKCNLAKIDQVVIKKE